MTKGGAAMISAGLAMMVLALGALVMVILTSSDADQDSTNVEEPVVPQTHDGLPRVLTSVS
jgi:hypothetical protein